MLKQDYYTDFFELGQQKINFSFFELCLPDDDPVYTLKKEPEIQPLYEELEATFMRMKDDHMKNGQLKAAYNIQIAVENYFIVQTYVSNDRTDYHTLIPVLEKHKNAFGKILEEVTADSGYCSEKNLLYLKKYKISSYIKLQDHEKRKDILEISKKMMASAVSIIEQQKRKIWISRRSSSIKNTDFYGRFLF